MVLQVGKCNVQGLYRLQSQTQECQVNDGGQKQRPVLILFLFAKLLTINPLIELDNTVN